MSLKKIDIKQFNMYKNKKILLYSKLIVGLFFRLFIVYLKELSLVMEKTVKKIKKLIVENLCGMLE